MEKVFCATLTLRRLLVYKTTRLRVAVALCFAVERVERGIESFAIASQTTRLQDYKWLPRY